MKKILTYIILLFVANCSGYAQKINQEKIEKIEKCVHDFNLVIFDIEKPTVISNECIAILFKLVNCHPRGYSCRKND